MSSPDPGSPLNELSGVSAASPTSAWAVGDYQKGKAEDTLILHWNGTKWSTVPSPNPSAHFNELRGVSAVSGKNAWGVGEYYNGTKNHIDTLIVRWNGTGWSKASSPGAPFAGDDHLDGVSAVDATNAWAVGYAADTNGAFFTLTLRWNGTKWSRVASPGFGPASLLRGVSALSATKVWAPASPSSRHAALSP